MAYRNFLDSELRGFADNANITIINNAVSKEMAYHVVAEIGRHIRYYCGFPILWSAKDFHITFSQEDDYSRNNYQLVRVRFAGFHFEEWMFLGLHNPHRWIDLTNEELEEECNLGKCSHNHLSFDTLSRNFQKMILKAALDHSDPNRKKLRKKKETENK